MKYLAALILLSTFSAQARACPNIVGFWECVEAGTGKQSVGERIRKEGKKFVFSGAFITVPAVPGETLTLKDEGKVLKIGASCTANTFELQMQGPGGSGSQAFTLQGSTLTVVDSSGVRT